MDTLSLSTYALLTLLAGSVIFQKFRLRRKDKDIELVLNRINDAVVSLDNEWRYTFLNEAALATHPHGRKNTLGKLLWDVHPELKGTIIAETYREAMSNGRSMEIESYYQAMDKWFLIKAYPSDTGLTIFYQDITERKIIKSRLTKSEEKYRTLFFKSPLPMWLYDIGNLNFVDVNDAAVIHYGYTREEFLSMTIKDIRPHEDVEMLLKDIAEVQIGSDKSRHGKWRHQKKNGEIISVETTGYSFNHYEKTVRIIIINDITEKELAEQQLLENQVKLKEAQEIAHISN